MRLSILFLVFFVLCAAADAVSVGVVPDKLIFDQSEKKAAIINPNNATLGFRISAEHVKCEPAQGSIGPESRADISCTALSGADNDIILVETEGSDKNIGIIPAVAIKAEIPGKKTEKETSNGTFENGGEAKTGAGPLMISGQNTNSADTEEENEGLFHEMPAEMTTIVILIAAILCVLAYPGIKKMRRKKEKNPEREQTPNESTCASLTRDAQAGQSSAEASASQNPPG